MTTTRQPATDQVTEVLSRIQVQRPYFAFEQMTHLGGGIVSAPVEPAAATGAEVGPWSASQVARHLAILGSCGAALASDDDAPRHYLAAKAHFARLAASPPQTPTGGLEATAVGSWIDKRNARAFVRLLGPQGEGLYGLDTSYLVLTPKTFERFHPSRDPVDTKGSGPSGSELGIEAFTFENSTVQASCGPIPPGACAGHFPGYPAAPVAVVMGALGEAAGICLDHQLDRECRYRVEEARVVAAALGAAGQELQLTVSYQEQNARGHLLRGIASAEGTTIGELDVVMTVHEPQHSR